jgi:hypothetical protein
VATIFSSVRIDHLEIAKWSFVALYVVSTAGVVIGVFWENPKFPESKQHRGWRLLIASLGAEMLLGSLIFATDGWISSKQRSQIIALSPRHLSPEQQADIASRLTGFDGKIVWIGSYWLDTEGLLFAGVLAETLKKAHLVPNMGGVESTLPLESVSFGVHIASSNVELLVALYHAFSPDMHASPNHWGPYNGEYCRLPPADIHVDASLCVGVKPLEVPQ